MKLQVIKSHNGQPEYILLPIKVYVTLRPAIEKVLAEKEDVYLPFDVEDYIDNPITLARIKAHLTQQELAKLMGVSQAYISKIERQTQVTPKLLNKVNHALANKKK